MPTIATGSKIAGDEPVAGRGRDPDLWVTSDPELITITPEPAGGCLITVELTTRPHQLTVTLADGGIEPIRPYRPEGPTARDG